MSSERHSSIRISPSILYFGTPVALITTLNPDGSPNISPMSSVWALDDRLVLGLGEDGQGCRNLLRTSEGVVSMPGPEQHAAVETLAPTTGRNPVPERKRAMGYRHEPDKFGLASLTPVQSCSVASPRVAECPIQMEVRVLAAHRATRFAGHEPAFRMIEAQVVQVHAHERIVIPGTQHISTDAWSPLLYVFRHYFGTGARLGRNFRAET
jgi:flavin reductase (DIM6/NTAB) family NADH-FMN oxidoreductase RutF